MLKRLTTYWDSLYTQDTGKFLEAVMDYFDDKELRFDVMQLLNRYNQISKERKKGLIESKEYIEILNQIGNMTLDVLKTIQTEYLPILPIKAFANNNPDTHYIIEHEEIEEWKRVKHQNVSDKIGIRVEGDSMNPHYQDGEILLCKKTTPDSIPTHKPIIVLTKDGRVFLKNAKRDSKSLKLSSLNTEYPPFELTIKEIEEIWEVETKIK